MGSAGTLGTLVGSLKGQPGYFATTSIYIVEPILLGILLPTYYCNNRYHATRLLQRSLDCALIVVTLLGILVYVAPRIGATIPTALIDAQYQVGDISEGVLRSNYQGWSSTVFLATYGIIRFFRPMSSSRLWTALLLACSLITVMISGRRILLLAAPFAVLVTLLCMRRPKANRGNFLSTSAAVAAALAVAYLSLPAIGIHPNTFIGRISNMLTNGAGDDPRPHQHNMLINAWMESPIYGQGAGAVIHGYSRNSLTPWAFELTYESTLMSFGLVGFAILTVWLLFTLTRLRRSASPLAAPVFAGCISALTSSTLDPYLLKLEGMWMLFIPFAIAVSNDFEKPHITPLRRRRTNVDYHSLSDRYL